jgi:hypothetical protein
MVISPPYNQKKVRTCWRQIWQPVMCDGKLHMAGTDPSYAADRQIVKMEVYSLPVQFMDWRRAVPERP